MAYLQVMENNLQIGDVLSITSNNGTTLKALQMLIGNQTKATISLDETNNVVVFEIKDTDLNLPSLVCNLKKDTIKDLIVNLKIFYNQLESEDN